MKKYFNKQNIAATILIIVIGAIIMLYVFETLMLVYHKLIKP